MKIKIINSCAGIGFSYAGGEVEEVSNELALDLIRAGHAEAIKAAEYATAPEEKETAAIKRGKGK